MTEEILVDGETFFVAGSAETGGLFHRDTRTLSTLSIAVDGQQLTRIKSHSDWPWHRQLTLADLTTTVNRIEESAAQKHTNVVLQRQQVVAEGFGLAERLRLTNHAPRQRRLALSITVDADFSDVFEVRDLETDLDRTVESTPTEESVTFRYDPARTETKTVGVGVDPRPDGIESEQGGTATTIRYDRVLDAQSTQTITLAALLDTVAPAVSSRSFRVARERARERPVSLGTDHLAESAYGPLFTQAARDLTALVTPTDHGPVALAGVPWFATVFGRDAIITAYQTLHLVPELAVGTLRYLAAHQGTTTDAYREERPGKILHEHRSGELARRGEIPHYPYYGTVDATPLWLVLLDETITWTGETTLLAELWPHVERAVEWITTAIDRTGDDPFLYYEGSDDGLTHKAWRDTADSIQFADGTVAEPPLASVEVQGYVYDALLRASDLARRRDRAETADRWRARAREIRDAFADTFWLSDRSYFGAALTGDGRVVDSVTSNVGHCLWSGIVPEARADAVVERLLDDGLNSGWGVRTMSRRAAGYSPVSYHVGSVWPHDNALVALGTNAYGYREATEQIATDVLDACLAMDDRRVPELYCGFDDSHPPQRYPAACEPQAWGAGTPFAMTRALFDLQPGEDGPVPGTDTDRVDFDPVDHWPVPDGREG
ncbi:hypothetical protein BRC91_09910 [Halobacteriales archaeon QS_4_62_28]|nr:MAG: hypothetical protein BRC91_09910 [Halobacteriales archaeon QS_4_62_28]